MGSASYCGLIADPYIHMNDFTTVQRFAFCVSNGWVSFSLMISIV